MQFVGAVRLSALGLVASLILGCGSAPGSGTRPDLLLVAPFHQGLAPAQDDPDTLRIALRRGVGRLRMLPRNVVSPEEIRRAILESDPEVIWIRGDRQYDGWVERVPETWGGLIIRSTPRPQRGAASEPNPSPSGHPVLYATGGISDRVLADYAVRLFEALGRGLPLREANLQAAESERVWRLVGDEWWGLATSAPKPASGTK